MELLAAIDLKDGMCVRLVQGDFEQVTVFSDDPASTARHWQAQGAHRLHVVDLDGARDGHPVNIAAIKAIRAAVDIPVQVGGGLRNDETIRATLALGVERVILGTAAVRDPSLLTRSVERYDERIIVGLDARNGWVATAGWMETSQTHVLELLQQLAHTGVERIIYTDIGRDGTLTEPDYETTAALIQPDGAPPAVIASGGVAHVEHLVRLAALGVEGTIIGRALYTGDISLPAALAALSKGESA